MSDYVHKPAVFVYYLFLVVLLMYVDAMYQKMSLFLSKVNGSF